MRRMGTPEEVAAAVLFLSLRGLGVHHRLCFAVDGGYLAQ